MISNFFRPLVFGLSVIVAGSLHSEPEDFPLPAETSSPRETLETFLQSTRKVDEYFQSPKHGDDHTQNLDWEIKRALDTLDLSEIPDFVKRQMSREAVLKLREILDRVNLPPMASIPGTGDPSLPKIWRVPGTMIEIGRVESEGEETQYLFTSETVARLDDYYARVEPFPYQSGALPGFYERLRYVPGDPFLRRIVASLPNWTQRVWLNLKIWQWIGFVGSIAAGSFLLVFLICMARLSRRIDPSRHRIGLLVSSILPLAVLLVPFSLKWFANHGLALYGVLLEATNLILNVFLIATALFAVWGIGFRFVEVFAELASRSSRAMDRLLVRLFGRLATIFFAIVVLLEGGNSLGIPMTTLIAGAGVGGLALALGAQAAVKNLVGSMMILLDKPYKVGERILTRGFDGIVDDVGIRSTRIKLLNGNIATIPNEEMAQAEVENISRRPYIQKFFKFYLPLNSTEEELATTLRILRETLADHDGMVEDFPPRVVIGGFERDGIEVLGIVWHHPPGIIGFPDWMESTTRTLLREFKENKIRLIPPARWMESPQDSAKTNLPEA